MCFHRNYRSECELRNYYHVRRETPVVKKMQKKKRTKERRRCVKCKRKRTKHVPPCINCNYHSSDTDHVSLYRSIAFCARRRQLDEGNSFSITPDSTDLRRLNHRLQFCDGNQTSVLFNGRLRTFTDVLNKRWTGQIAALRDCENGYENGFSWHIVASPSTGTSSRAEKQRLLPSVICKST